MQPQARSEIFSEFLAGLKRDAAAQGVPEPSSIPRCAVYSHCRASRSLGPEAAGNHSDVDQYLGHVATPDRIDRGRKLRADQKASLRAMFARYGVPPKTIMALWAIESSYGKAMGDFRVSCAGDARL